MKPPICPHCGLWHDGKVIARCPDTARWTDDERDAWRADARRRMPALRFAPSTATIQERFSKRNADDRAAATNTKGPT